MSSGVWSAVARALGISRPMVSRYLEQMEKWAGTRLVHRSTRKLTLTPAGEKVLLKVRNIIQLAQDIEDQSAKDVPAGTLRVALRAFYGDANRRTDAAGFPLAIRNYAWRWMLITIR